MMMIFNYLIATIWKWTLSTRQRETIHAKGPVKLSEVVYRRPTYEHPLVPTDLNRLIHYIYMKIVLKFINTANSPT